MPPNLSDDIEAGFNPIEVEAIIKATPETSCSEFTKEFRDYFTYKV